MSASASPSRLGRLADGRKSKPFNPIAFVLRRAPLILVLGLCFSLLLMPPLMSRTNPIYQTDAMLLLDPAKEPTVAGRDRDPIPGNIGDYTRTLVNRLTSYEVLEEALARLEGPDYPAFLGSPHPAERNIFRLMGRIRVRDVPRTWLISLTITADQPEGLGPVLNMVMEVFIEKIQQEQEYQYARRLTYLRDEQDKLQARLEGDRAALAALAEGMAQPSFLHEPNTLHINRQDMLQRLYWEALAQEAAARSLLEVAQTNRKNIVQLDLQPLVDERVADNQSINRIEHSTYDRLQILRASIDGLTPENPDRMYVEERMRAMNEFLEQYKKQVNETTSRTMRDKLIYELDREVVQAQNVYAAAAGKARDLRQLQDEAAAEGARISAAMFQASEILHNMRQLRERLNALNNRIDDAEMEIKAPVRLQISKRAVTPGSPARTNANMLMLVALGLSFGSVFGFVLVFDFLDNRLRDGAAVNAALGGSGPDPIAYLAEITHAAPEAEVLRSARVAAASLEASDQVMVRNINSLAVRLERERSRNQVRVVALCGLNPACGVTTLALNLAHILRSGCDRVLVVECNLQRPGTARLAPLNSQPGLRELLASGDAASWPRFIQHELRRGIDLLPAGQPASGPSEPIPSRAVLTAILALARRQYDVVLLDCDAVLSDAVAHTAALQADATLLVAREDISLYRDLRRTIDRLVEAEIPALTAVLNLARPRRGERLLGQLYRLMQLISRVHRRLHRMVARPLARRRPRP